MDQAFQSCMHVSIAICIRCTSKLVALTRRKSHPGYSLLYMDILYANSIGYLIGSQNQKLECRFGYKWSIIAFDRNILHSESWLLSNSPQNPLDMILSRLCKWNHCELWQRSPTRSKGVGFPTWILFKKINKAGSTRVQTQALLVWCGVETETELDLLDASALFDSENARLVYCASNIEVLYCGI